MHQASQLGAKSLSELDLVEVDEEVVEVRQGEEADAEF